jgi:hypothetical protein
MSDDFSAWAQRARGLAAHIHASSYLLLHSQDLLVCDVWRSVPGDWQSYLEKLTFTELGRLHIDPLPTRCGDPPPSLAHFIALHRHLAIHRQPSDEEEVSDSASIGAMKSYTKAAKRAKKSHEVEKLSALIAAVAVACNCSRAIDIGCGKGSLASHLSALCGLDVVGLETQEDVAATAAALASRSAEGGHVRIWQRTIVPDEHAPAIVDRICSEAWPAAGGAAASSGVVLCALHACGDLSPTITRCFALAPSVAALVLVPCCYNLLTVDSDPCGAEHWAMRAVCQPCGTSPTVEAALSSSGTAQMPEIRPRTAQMPEIRPRTARVPSVALAAATTAGFPLSDTVRATGLVLSRDARMTATLREAAALPTAWLDVASATADGAAPPAAVLRQLWNCLFAALVRDRYADLVPAGTRVSTGGARKHHHLRARQQAQDQGQDETASTGRSEFVAFVEGALAQAGLPTNRLDRSELSRYAETRCTDGVVNAARRVAAIAALQAALAPLVESLLLVDHVLFLHESGVCEDIRAVPVFKPERSVRNVAIVARKRMPADFLVQ